MTIPCRNFKHRESIRVSMARYKTLFIQDHEPDFDFVISKTRGMKGEYLIKVTKVESMDQVVIQKANGSVETAKITSTHKSKDKVLIDDMLSKIRQAQKERMIEPEKHNNSDSEEGEGDRADSDFCLPE